MTIPVYYTTDGTNGGIEPQRGAGGAAFGIPKAWNPNTLAYSALNVNASGELLVAQAAITPSTDPVPVLATDPYSYVYAWSALTGKLSTISRTRSGVTTVKTFSWDAVTGKLLTISAWV